MKKSLLILGGVVIFMSGLSNIALSEASQWNPYVLDWDLKLPVAKEKKPVKKPEPITICSVAGQLKFD